MKEKEKKKDYEERLADALIEFIEREVKEPSTPNLIPQTARVLADLIIHGSIC